ncbi:MAG: dihydropteroate synthase [Candidatus Omnitrophica bacterium]|nr:dihydropteroate synthase [Candidatus Omnitrophota bacterium]
MGIVNATPDSFSQDGCLVKHQGARNWAVHFARKHIKDGANIIDIGGESTRPGARRISAKEEIGRVLPIILSLAKTAKIPISIDTYKPIVAKAALDAGASIVNNIMGTNPNASLLKMVKNYNAAIVLMHIKGTPRTMQKNIHYDKLTDEIISSLKKSIEKCLEIGIKLDRIIIDPGIGFGKTVEHNLEILNRLGDFKRLGRPLLVGTSRKSFIGKVIGRDVHHRLIGTAVTVCASVLHGAHIVRVHDVKAIKEAVTMTDAIINEHYTERSS